MNIAQNLRCMKCYELLDRDGRCRWCEKMQRRDLLVSMLACAIFLLAVVL